MLFRKGFSLQRGLRTTVSKSAGGVASPPVQVGGYAVGDAGLAGSIYEGFTLAYADDFNSLDVIGPTSPHGKYLTTQNYRVGGRMPGGQLLNQYDSDPFNTGPGDSNRGVPLGSDNIKVASSILSLVCRKGTTAEVTASGRPNVGAGFFTDTAILGYPDAAGSGDVIFEWRVRRVATGSAGGAHFDLWTRTGERPLNPTSNQDINWENGSMNQVLSGVPLDVDSPGGFTPNPGATDLPNFHVVGWNLTKDHAAGVKAYKDGVLFDTGQFNGNLPDQINRMMMTNHIVDTELNQANFDAGGSMSLDIDYIRVWNRTAKKRYKPAATVADVNIAFGGSTTITLPSAVSLWGEVPTAEIVQQLQIETNEPGASASVAYNSFSAGVSYNSTTRVLTVAPSGPNAGRMFFQVLAKTAGCTCEPLIFCVNVGPVVNASSTYAYTPGTAFSLDLYALCDAGTLVTNGTGCTKDVSITGTLPSGLSYSKRAGTSGTGLITGTPTADGDKSLTITVTNSIGQTATKSISLTQTAVPAGDVIPGTLTTDVTTHTGTTVTSTGLGAVAADETPLIFIASRAAAARTISSVTIGGVACSSLFEQTSSDGQTRSAWYIGPKGSTGQVTVTYSGSVTRCRFGLVPCKNVVGSVATSTAGSSGTSPQTLTLASVTAGGAILAGAENNGSSANYTWSGVTELFDTAASPEFTVAGAVFSTAQTNKVVTATIATTSSFNATAAIAIR